VSEGTHREQFEPRLIFWEVTSACNLKCIHCRATPANARSTEELTTEEACEFIDRVISFAKPVIVLSGGEPLVRSDVFEIASYANSKGIPVALATNGTLVTPETARKIKGAGIRRVSVSIDGADDQTHDRFRQVTGAFEASLQGIEYLKAEEISFQINTTVTKHNVHQLPEILDLAVVQGAIAWHVFLLVPAGCGKDLAQHEMIEPADYERVLNWIYERSKDSPISIKPTCAPHYLRVAHQRAAKEGINFTHEKKGLDAVTKGCLAGSSVCFVSSKGDVYPCGYLPIKAGSIRQNGFQEIWQDASVFRDLRDANNLKGKCGICEFRWVCMGCRARAYGMTGDFLAPEPFCIYKPDVTCPEYI